MDIEPVRPVENTIPVQPVPETEVREDAAYANIAAETPAPPPLPEESGQNVDLLA